MNQRTDSDTEFFGVVIEIIQIDDSKPAFNFKPVVFPNEWQKSKRRPPSQTSEKMESYRNYFQLLIDELREKHKFTNARKGQPQSWYSFSSGYSGIIYGMSFALGDRARVDLYIDQGEAGKNKALFDLIYHDRELIENDFGEELEWERLDDKRSCRIAIYRDGSIENDEKVLQDIRNWSIEKLLLFKKVFPARLKKYLSSLQ